MKATLSSILLSLAYTLCYAQTQRAFISSEGAVTDSAHASFYLLVDQASDTAWVMQQFDMKNRLLSKGTYKDADLATPHGTFLYYNEGIAPGSGVQGSGTGITRVDANNVVKRMYLRTKGQYLNGKKNGIWTDYFQEGNIELVYTLKDGVLNGPFYNYDHDSDKVKVRGINVNGEKDGKVEFLNELGNVWQVAIYRKGKLLSVREVERGEAKIPSGLKEQWKANLKDVFDEKLDIQMLLAGIVDEKGVLKDVRIISGRKIEPAIINKLKAALISDLLWQPGFEGTGKNKKNIQVNVSIALQVKNGKITIDYPVPAKYDLAYSAFLQNGADKSSDYTLVSTRPVFPGGDERLRSFVLNKLKNKIDEKDDITVTVQFIISPTGTVSDVKVTRKGSIDTNIELLRAINAMPKWEPGYINGEPVQSEYSISVKFVIPVYVKYPPMQ